MSRRTGSMRMRRASRRRRWLPAAALGGLVVLIGLAAGPACAVPGAGGATPASLGGFTAAAQAPVMQITEDEPTSTFHPEGEGEYSYSLVEMSPAAASALSATVWPGSAAGNAGSLVGVLGGPSAASALNDPVRAQAATGTDQTSQNLSTPTGTVMSAAVASDADGAESAVAQASLAGGSLGAGGTVGDSSTGSSLAFDPATGTLTASASSHAGSIELAGGLVSIGSVTSSASAVSTDAAAPVETGRTVFQDFTIAGQSAYVDASGVHLGTPGEPAPSTEQQLVDSALAATGMQIYFTDPHEMTVGQVAYYYAGSVLFYWRVPEDPSDNSLTFSLGGAAVAMQVAPGAAGATATGSSSPAPDSGTRAPVSAGARAGGGFPAAVSVPGAETSLSLPTRVSPGTVITADREGGPGWPAHPLGVLAGDAGVPGGLGAGWWLLVLIGGVLGAVLLTRLPSLFASSSSACPRERRP